MNATSNYQRIGGEEKLRAIIDLFVERVMDDSMIGFFFGKISRTRLKEFEFQHAAKWLGADIEYQGRELRDAHKSHPIMGGHFDRRKMILAKVLREKAVPEDIIEAWLAHTESLRSQITSQGAGECR